jgi:hypothetical protein
MLVEFWLQFAQDLGRTFFSLLLKLCLLLFSSKKLSKFELFKKNFDSLVGDNPLQESTLTLHLFSQLLREVRIRKQRQAIQAHQETIARQQQHRPQTPPPKYSNAKSKKIQQSATN